MAAGRTIPNLARNIEHFLSESTLTWPVSQILSGLTSMGLPIHRNARRTRPVPVLQTQIDTLVRSGVRMTSPVF